MAQADPGTTKRAADPAAVLAATEELLAAGGLLPGPQDRAHRHAAGISRTAFYFYFKDKRELLMRLAEDITGELYGQADAWFSGDDGAPEDQVSEALEAIATLYFEHGPLLRAIVEVSTYDEEIAVFWRALLQRFADATTHRITTEQQDGRAPRCPPPRPRSRSSG
jgi:AcrR family transcriptional regulator